MLASGYYGPEIWTSKASSFLGFEATLGDLTFRDVWVPILTVGVFVGHLPFWYAYPLHTNLLAAYGEISVLNVIAARRRDGLPVLPVFLEWFPMVAFTASCCAWLYSPYSTLLAENHLVLFCLTITFVFGRMTTKIILAHLTKQPFPYWTMMLVPLIVGAVLVNGPLVGL